MKTTLVLNGKEYGYADDNSNIYSLEGFGRYEKAEHFNSWGYVYAEPKSPFGTKERIGRIDFCNAVCELYYYDKKVGEIGSSGNLIISGEKIGKCYGDRFGKMQTGAACLLLYFHAGLAPSSSDSLGASLLATIVDIIVNNSIRKNADKTRREIQQNITEKSDKTIERVDDVNGSNEAPDKNSDNQNKGIKGAIIAIIALVVIVMFIAIGSRG
ncbi:MAG: hypothetical protein HP008_03425 [Clostridia bacterium]|nr:hypothetical protein [Clostridia bacterium]